MIFWKENRTVCNWQWAVGSGQWAVGSGQWAVGSGQWAVGSKICIVQVTQWNLNYMQTLNLELSTFNFLSPPQGPTLPLALQE
jgi:hypothetical protein